jgi:transcriptional regulator with XRE-family HTH domain
LENSLHLNTEDVKGRVVIERLGDKVRRLREEAGLSQSELAAHLGLSARSKGYISEIESGKKKATIELVLRLAQHFGVTTDYLLRDDLVDQEDETI